MISNPFVLSELAASEDPAVRLLAIGEQLSNLIFNLEQVRENPSKKQWDTLKALQLQWDQDVRLVLQRVSV